MSDEIIIQTGEGELVDRVYSSPVDRWQHRFRTILLLVVLIVVLFVTVSALLLSRGSRRRIHRYPRAL